MRKVGVLGTVASLFAAGLSIAVAAPAAANGCSNTLFGGVNPDGSAGDPFLISTDTHLQNLQSNESCWASQYNFRQTTDIDMGDTTWSNHAIGYANGPTAFAGTYDGDGNEISGLTIDFGTGSTDGGDYAGLFGFLTGTVTNLGFTGAVFGDAAGQFAGGLVGYSNGGTVDNSYTTGAVEGYRSVGGLVGRNAGGTVTDSHATGAVTASGDYAGGLIAESTNSGSVTNSYATGSVDGDAYTGGLVGYNFGSGSDVETSYATGSVTGTGNYVGGLAGFSSGSVDNSYATGSVSGGANRYVGGLIGYSDSPIRRSYSVGSVSGTGNDVGGLVGRSDGSFTDDSFWNTQTSGQGSSDLGSGESTAEMQSLSTFEDANWSIAASWASSNTWGICEGSGYPYLTWQYTSNTEACGGGGSTPASSAGTARYTFTFLTSTGGVCFVDDNVAAGAYALPTSQVACTPAGSELVGWSVRGQVGAFSDGGVVTASGDQTFTAVAKDPTMEVIFDPNVGVDTACLLDGSEVESDQRAVSVTLPRGGVIGDVDICAPAGHTLAGWTDRPTTDGPYTPVDGASLLTTGREMPATWNHDPNPVNSIRLYAVWSAAA